MSDDDTLLLPDVRMVCGVCAIPLDIHNGEWAHGNPHADHLPVPVWAEDVQVIPQCDFCGGPATYTHGCMDFEFINEPLNDGSGGRLKESSLGAFAACSLCHEDILNARWGDMATRAVLTIVGNASERGETISPSQISGYISMATDIHQKFATHRTGEWQAGGYATLTTFTAA